MRQVTEPRLTLDEFLNYDNGTSVKNTHPVKFQNIGWSILAEVWFSYWDLTVATTSLETLETAIGLS